MVNPSNVCDTDSWVNDENALGHLVKYGVRYGLCLNEHIADGAMKSLRQVWPKLEPYWQRQIIVEVEVALLRNDTKPIAMPDEWRALVLALRGPKAPFTVDYRCGKCRRDGVKLWRGTHGCPDDDGHELLCAKCLAPDVVVDESGKSQEAGPHGMRTDQILGWLPAVPVGDTYWGYSSVPSQDVDWWKALPTYETLPTTQGDSDDV